MNSKKARIILEFVQQEPLTLDAIKRQYRLLAKKYHPDKNASIDAGDSFRRIHEAYIYLSKKAANANAEAPYTDTDSDADSNDSSDSAKSNTTKSIFLDAHVMLILRKILSYSFDTCLEYLKKIDKRLLQLIYDICSGCEFVNDSLLEKMAVLLRTSEENSQRIVMHPLLCDLFNEQVYRLKLSPTVEYLVPLWHHQLVYDYMGSEVCVECFPILSENITIDEKNNIHVVLLYKKSELWEMEDIVFEIGGRTFSIARKELLMTEKQCKIIAGQGIPRINNENVYDTCKKSDVWVYIHAV
jgi:hypothetical protein